MQAQKEKYCVSTSSVFRSTDEKQKNNNKQTNNEQTYFEQKIMRDAGYALRTRLFEFRGHSALSQKREKKKKKKNGPLTAIAPKNRLQTRVFILTIFGLHSLVCCYN